MRLAGWPAGVNVAPSEGISLRTTLKALIRFGAPPDRFWPFDDQHARCDPVDPFLFSFHREYAPLCYFRIDPPGVQPDQLLVNLRRLLAAGIPCVCGFSVPKSLTQADRIPPASRRDELLSGQAVLVLGYDERSASPRKRRQPAERSRRKRRQHADGALLIRSYWGTCWGDRGDGWLPYQYVTDSLANSFWCVLKREWVKDLVP